MRDIRARGRARYILKKDRDVHGKSKIHSLRTFEGALEAGEREIQTALRIFEKERGNATKRGRARAISLCGFAR